MTILDFLYTICISSKEERNVSAKKLRITAICYKCLSGGYQVSTHGFHFMMLFINHETIQCINYSLEFSAFLK